MNRLFMFSVISLLLLWLPLWSISQQKAGFCGTKTVPIEKIRAMGIPGYFGCDVINRVERTLQISVHISVDTSGQTNISQGTLDGALDQLNLDFAPCGLQFQYCFQEIMPNDRFDSLDVFSYHNEEAQMTSIHFEPNTINLYLVDTIGLEGMPDVAGYAGGIVVIEKSSYSFGSKVQAHEFGHFFGLPHTFETAYGMELADGSNCDTSGDLICDTEADPDPEGTASPLDCFNYAGSVVQDANGDWYLPPTDNIMSYYPCGCRFTVQQYNRMTWVYLNALNFLW
jgi:hypothetical protein